MSPIQLIVTAPNRPFLRGAYHFNGFLYTPGDFRDLAEKLKRFVISPELLETLGQNGQRWVEGRFTLDAYVDQVLQVLRQVVQKRHAGTISQ